MPLKVCQWPWLFVEKNRYFIGAMSLQEQGETSKTNAAKSGSGRLGGKIWADILLQFL